MKFQTSPLRPPADAGTFRGASDRQTPVQTDAACPVGGRVPPAPEQQGVRESGGDSVRRADRQGRWAWPALRSRHPRAVSTPPLLRGKASGAGAHRGSWPVGEPGNTLSWSWVSLSTPGEGASEEGMWAALLGSTCDGDCAFAVGPRWETSARTRLRQRTGSGRPMGKRGRADPEPTWTLVGGGQSWSLTWTFRWGGWQGRTLSRRGCSRVGGGEVCALGGVGPGSLGSAPVWKQPCRGTGVLSLPDQPGWIHSHGCPGTAWKGNSAGRFLRGDPPPSPVPGREGQAGPWLGAPDGRVRARSPSCLIRFGSDMGMCLWGCGWGAPVGQAGNATK